VIGYFVGDRATSTAETIAVSVVVLGFLAVLAYRWLREGIYVDGQGVVVRNAYRSTTATWDEIDGFELGTGRDFPRYGLMHLRSGKTIYIRGIAPAGSPEAREESERLIRTLNGLLPDQRQGAGRAA
jgi:hypothetical protein